MIAGTEVVIRNKIKRSVAAKPNREPLQELTLGKFVIISKVGLGPIGHGENSGPDEQ